MAIDLSNEDGAAFYELLNHKGHKLEIVTYGDCENVAIECVNCHTVLVDFDNNTKDY